MKIFATALCGLALFAAPGFATGPDILINGGNMDFDFQEFPSGPITGHFASVGEIVAAPAGSGTAATTYVLDGTNYLTVVGALEDGLNFYDGAAIILASPIPIVAGTYPLDAISGLFVFVDDAASWTPPVDIWNTNWTSELSSIVAAGKYGSISGSVTLTSVSASLIAGTFDVTVNDPDTGTMLTITAGSFNLESSTAVDAGTWGSIKSLYR